VAITKEVFERGYIFEKPEEKNYVLDFLKKNKDNKTYAHKVPEIAKETGKSETSIRQRIKELTKKGLVTKKMIDIGRRHLIPYYRIKDRRGRKKK